MAKKNEIQKYLYENDMTLKELQKKCGINYSTLSMYKTNKLQINEKNKTILRKKCGFVFDGD